jgi:hypothetical protein
MMARAPTVVASVMTPVFAGMVVVGMIPVAMFPRSLSRAH